MDKNIIRQHLKETFLSEATTPAEKLGNQIMGKNKKANKDGVSAIAKDVTKYEKSLTKPDANEKTMAQNKFNYTDDSEKEYHDEMEIMNGMEMNKYDRTPDENFKERALEAIEGSSRMGNNPEWANVVVKGQGGDPEFGKNLVKKIKASEKKRAEQTPTTKMFGDDWEVVKDKGHKSYAFESQEAKPTINESFPEKNIRVMTSWVESLGAKEAAVKLINRLSQTGLVSDLPDSIEYGNGLNKITAMLEKGNFEMAFKSAKNLANKLEKKAMRDMMGEGSDDTQMQENNNMTPHNEKITKNNPQIKESMKRLKFKKEFNGVGNALKMIPESYKVDKKVFEMTDGNESYRVRWEGTLTEGKAVVLMASDKKMVNEDIQKMKHLMGYKSEETLGNVKGKDRITENATFADIFAKTKRLMEMEDIDGQDAEKEAEFDKADISHAPEAKKHVQGSVSTEKGTQAPKPKEGHWDKISVPQAAEAKKHVEGSTSTEKGTKAPKPKTGDLDDAVSQAPEAKKHVEEKKAKLTTTVKKKA